MNTSQKFFELIIWCLYVVEERRKKRNITKQSLIWEGLEIFCSAFRDCLWTLRFQIPLSSIRHFNLLVSLVILPRTVRWGSGYKSSLTSSGACWASPPYRDCWRNWAVSRRTWSSCSLKNDAIWFDTVWNQGTWYGTRNCRRVTWNIWRWDNVTRSWFGRWRSSTTIIRQ